MEIEVKEQMLYQLLHVLVLMALLTIIYHKTVHYARINVYYVNLHLKTALNVKEIEDKAVML